MTVTSNFSNQVLKYILYLFPIFIILGNALINFSLIIVCLIYLLVMALKKINL